jgi:hypothetical protein
MLLLNLLRQLAFEIVFLVDQSELEIKPALSAPRRRAPVHRQLFLDFLHLHEVGD